MGGLGGAAEATTLRRGVATEGHLALRFLSLWVRKPYDCCNDCSRFKKRSAKRGTFVTIRFLVLQFRLRLGRQLEFEL